MKKSNLFLLLPLILLASCNTKDSSNSQSTPSSTSSSPSTSISSSSTTSSSNNSSSSTISSSTSHSSSSSITSSNSSSIAPTPIDPIEMPMNLDELKVYLNNEGKTAFIANEAESTLSIEEGNYFSYMGDITEDINKITKQFKRFEGNYASGSIERKIFDRSNINNEISNEKTVLGNFYKGTYNNDVIDSTIFETDLSNSSIHKFQLVEEDTNLESFKLNLNEQMAFASSYFESFTSLNKQLNDLPVSAIYDLEHKVGQNFNYTLTCLGDKETAASQFKSYSDTIISIGFDNSGFLTTYHITFKEYGYDWLTDAHYTTPSTFKILDFTAKKGTLAQAEPLAFNPSDYMATSATIQLINKGSYDKEILEPQNIILNTSLGVKVENPIPATAIDLDFEIISSSDTDVVGLKYGDWTALKIGTATLTIANSNGCTQTIDVTVKEPVLTSISISLTENMTTGEEYFLYISKTPSDVTDTFTVISSDETIAKIVERNDNIYVQALKAGTVTITVTSIQHPNVYQEKTVTIKDALSDEEIKQIICSHTWFENHYYHGDLLLNFNLDGTGTFQKGYYDPISFTWTISNKTITLSSFSISGIDFVNNTATLNEEGTELEIKFEDEYAWDTIQETLQIHDN